MRTRSQKFSTPLTVVAATCVGSLKLTSPDLVKALVVSVNSLAIGVCGPLRVDVPMASHSTPFHTSHRSLRLREAADGRWRYASGAVGLTRVIGRVILAPASENVSPWASQNVSPNLGFSPKGKKSLLKSTGS